MSDTCAFGFSAAEVDSLHRIVSEWLEAQPPYIYDDCVDIAHGIIGRAEAAQRREAELATGETAA